MQCAGAVSKRACVDSSLAPGTDDCGGRWRVGGGYKELPW